MHISFFDRQSSVFEVKHAGPRPGSAANRPFQRSAVTGRNEFSRTAALATMILAGVQFAPASEDLPTQPSVAVSIEELYRRTSPAVGTVDALDKDGNVLGTGSGFLVQAMNMSDDPNDKNSYFFEIVTCYHVIRPALKARVRLGQESTLYAFGVAAEDPAKDLAVLICMAHFDSPGVPTPLPVAADGLPPVGTRVFTIGNPRGLTSTLSDGLIAGHRQRREDLTMLQMSAPVSPGSSGSPVLDSAGRVVGVVSSSVADAQQLNFAVPSTALLPLLGPRANPRARLVSAGADPLENEPTSESIGHALQRRFERARARALLEELDRLERGVVQKFAEHGVAATRPAPSSNGTASTRPSASPEAGLDTGDEVRFERYVEEQVKQGNQVALLYRGAVALESGDLAAATSWLARARAAPAGDQEHVVEYLRGMVEERSIFGSGGFQPSELERILPYWERAAELDANAAYVHYSLCVVYRFMDRHADMLLSADRLVRLVPRSYAGYLYRGTAWCALGRIERAEADFMTATDLHPISASVFEEIGQAYSRARDTVRAMRAFREALRIAPDRWLPALRLGTYLKENQQYNEAAELLKSALRSAPDDLRAGIEEAIRECKDR